MNADDVEVTEKTTPFKGYFQIDRYRLRHKLFEGGWSGEMEREVFERGHAVTILLFDPERDRLVFIEQFRPGAYAALASPWFDNGASPWLTECVAGIIEPGENPEAVARREAVEEADCAVGDIIPVCHYLVSPGATSESMFVYCGRVTAPKSGGIHGLSEEHENIRVVVVSPDEAFRWLDEGRIINAMTVVALQWFRIHVDDVRARWGAIEIPTAAS
ncbi:MAG: NUDIX domain-containing protein [Rhodospirillales bacterium]|jgi:ADP-ribose pyrophosphatase|nr:NUDIX domain-containing protein [Rhodospirillales bacterium]